MEQKNGSVVRRLVGYGRLSGSDARNALAELHASSRLYIKFFQPSFKLKSKTRDGARVHKVYLAPETPCDRLLAHESVQVTVKEKLRAQFNSLDSVRLLREMRTAQQTLSEFAAHGRCAENALGEEPVLADFLSSLALAWKEGEARPTHQKRSKATHWWRTRVDPFADVWPVIEGWMLAEPSIGTIELMDRLALTVPDLYASKAQLRTLQRRVKAWRVERVKELVLGDLRNRADTEA